MARAKTDPDNLGVEDHELWAHVTRDAKPLKATGRMPPSMTERGAEKGKPASGAAVSGPADRLPPAEAGTRTSAGKVPGRSMETAPAIDRRTAEKLRRGLLAIEARLDLHGHTQSEAHAALTSFIETSWRAGHRCILVITGKGGIGRQAGVLRTAVPGWLDIPPLRERILAAVSAQPKDGGAGALYVLLRRKR